MSVPYLATLLRVDGTAMAQFESKSFDHGIAEFSVLVKNYAVCVGRVLERDPSLETLETHRLVELGMTDADEALIAEKLACIYGSRLLGILKRAAEDIPDVD